MPIVLTCACGKRLQIQDKYAGQEGKCPKCGRTFEIPAPLDDPDAPFSLEPARRAEPEPQPEPEPEPPPEVAPLDEPVSREPTRRQAERREPPPLPRQPEHREARREPRRERSPAPAGPLVQEDGKPVTNHGGDTLPRDIDFFVGAPQEIGPLVTADSSLRQHMKPRSAAARAAIILVSAIITAWLMVVVVFAIRPREKFFYFFWPMVLGGLAALIAGLATRFKHRCSYVGRDGVARYQCTGDRDRVSMSQLFVFRDAAEVRTGQTRRYVNGVYQGTDFTFTWSDVAGRTRYVHRGTYKAEGGNPRTSDPYHFGKSAELAFTMSLLPEVFQRLDMGGDVRFNVSGGRWVRLGPGYMIVRNTGGEEQWDGRDIAGVQIQQGVVYIRRRDAKEGWFSSTGVFKFDFAALANAQLFIYLVEKVVGVRVG
jgi:hypothetical protein